MVTAGSPAVSAYFSLHPQLQKNIVSRLGWRSLRPVQEQAIPPLLKGHDAVILAPTAGGKTESAMFPILSNIASAASATGPQVIYLCPLKALINNLLHRLQQLAALVNREAFSWHGEVSQSKRKQFLKDPKAILLTTPESLQVMLSRPNIDPAELFGETLLYAAWMDSGVSPLCMVDRDIVLRSPVLRDMACSSSWFDFRLRLSKSSCATTGVTREENAPRRVK